MDLKDFLTEHYQVFAGLFVFISGLFTISVKSYFTERGKLKAQIAENKKLVEQAETIKSRFNRELEELKKEHQLEISKRKYQYESKKEQYLKFFRLLDEFAKEYNVKTQEAFLPILEEVNKNYINAINLSKKKNETAIVVFQKKVQKLIFDANQDLIRVKQETNTIRLIASNSILQKLDLLALAYDKSMDASTKMMKEMLQLMLTNDQEKMQKQQQELEIAAMVISDIKNDIINLMRDELNEI